jgi:L-ascorbate metabolism protein UlaG (beta-lactamase superfamily)
MSAFGAKPGGLRLERMQASPRYVDGSFRNKHPVAPELRKGSMVSAMGQFVFGGQRRTPKGPLPSVNPLPRWAGPAETGFRATWLGHSTVLLEIDGVRVLTDPVWGERASPFGFTGPRRFQPVPVAIDQLPPLDAVIISHDHYDHLDHPTILAMAKLDVPFYTSLGVGAHLESWGVRAARITELDWWESVEVRGVSITAAPSQHFSGRGLGGRNATLWSSFALRGPRHSVFFSGDTGLTSEYEEIRRRLGPFDLVMLEVGAYHPAWGDVHLGPANALEALALLGGGRFLPVHWGTFNLAIHAWDEPAESLLTLAPARDALLVMPRLGEAIEPTRTEGVSPWWREVGTVLVADAANKPKKAQEQTVDPPVPEPAD